MKSQTLLTFQDAKDIATAIPPGGMLLGETEKGHTQIMTQKNELFVNTYFTAPDSLGFFHLGAC